MMKKIKTTEAVGYGGDSQTANFFLGVILVVSFLVMVLYNYLFSKEGKNR